VANVVILCTQEEIRRIVICAQGIGPQVKLQHKKKKKKKEKERKKGILSHATMWMDPEDIM
jgi:hypothetical protein